MTKKLSVGTKLPPSIFTKTLNKLKESSQCNWIFCLRVQICTLLRCEKALLVFISVKGIQCCGINTLRIVTQNIKKQKEVILTAMRRVVLQNC